MSNTPETLISAEPLVIYDPAENAGRRKVIFHHSLFGIGQKQELLSQELAREGVRMIAILNRDQKTGIVIPPGDIIRARKDPKSRQSFIDRYSSAMERGKWIAIEDVPALSFPTVS